YTHSERNLRPHFEIAVLLRKRFLGREDTRAIFVVEQHLLERGRRPARDNRQYDIPNPERSDAGRRQPSPFTTGIDIDLLLAIVFGLPPEFRTVSAPVEPFRLRDAARVVRL